MDNEIGKRYNKLTCLSKDRERGKDYYFFKCDCGNIKSMRLYNVKNGYSKSCGCLKKQSHRIHGGSGTRLYIIWKGMRQRCNDPNHKGYHRWGGKGIKVCKEWDDFGMFREWALESGYADNLTIDRIDGSKDYCPSNCRWATYEEQAENTCQSVLITVNGETHCLAKWERVLGLNRGHLSYMSHKGKNVVEYIEEIIKQNRVNKSWKMEH